MRGIERWMENDSIISKKSMERMERSAQRGNILEAFGARFLAFARSFSLCFFCFSERFPDHPSPACPAFVASCRDCFLARRNRSAAHAASSVHASHAALSSVPPETPPLRAKNSQLTSASGPRSMRTSRRRRSSFSGRSAVRLLEPCRACAFLGNRWTAVFAFVPPRRKTALVRKQSPSSHRKPRAPFLC